MRRRGLLALAVLALVVLAGYRAVGEASWVYDDHRFVAQNPALDTLDVAAYFRDPSTASADAGIQHDIYRPLRTLDYALDTAAFGRDDATPFHLKNVLLHLLAAVLVFRVIQPLVGGRPGPALVGALLFAAHPVAVESVAWVSSRGDLLAVLGMLAALVVLERPGFGRTVVGLLLAFLACLAKESALAFPALLLLRDLALPSGTRLPLGITLRRTGLLAIVVAAYLVLRLQVLPDLAQTPEFLGGSRAAAARGMLAGLNWYAKALVWPSGFPFDLQLPVPGRWSDPSVVAGAGILGTLLLAGAHGVRRRTALAFATWGTLACLVPVSNVLVPLKALVAERFLYPVLVCVAVGLAWGLSRLAARSRAVALALAGLVVVALLVVTASRVSAWRDDLTLWERVARDRPGHMRAYEGLAFEYLRRGQIRRAEAAYQSYLLHNPADAKSMVLLAEAFGDVARALRQTGSPSDVIVGGEGRRLARRAQLELYRRALDTWARIGLVRGRGSPDLLRAVHLARIEAAVDFGDVDEARRANDALLRLDGLDPEDTEGVLAEASVTRRRTRLNLALMAVLQRPRQDLDAIEREAYLERRAAVLRDVGIAPSLPDREVLVRLRPLLRRLVDEPGADPRDAQNLALVLETLGKPRDAAEVRRKARLRWPDGVRDGGGR